MPGSRSTEPDSVLAVLSDTPSPTIHRWTRRPQRIVSFIPSFGSFFGVQLVPDSHAIEQLPKLAWGRDDELVLDFGIHMVGFLSFRLSCVDRVMDAPCRLRLTFGESPLDVTMDMEGVETWISKAWLPDEVINVDMCPEDVTIRRRHAFRFLRIQVIDTSSAFKVAFSNVSCECVSAVSQDHKLDDIVFDDPLLQHIDRVCVMTLRDCIQSVFEDGPRRDRRMWIGDLRLQALANYATLRDLPLVRRCMLQFAAVAREDGSLPACLYEKPDLHSGEVYLADYDALFASIVYDYVVESGDLETGALLWPTVLSCLSRPMKSLNPKTFLFEPGRTTDVKFLDWEKTVDKTAGSHGVVAFSLKAAQKLADLLSVPFPHEEAIKKMDESAKSFLENDIFVSGSAKQISYASASWLVLAEVFPKDVARAALLSTLKHPEAVKPLTPYLWHYMCDALVSVGCHDECLEIIRTYWGGMVKAGADTFWECYDPENSRASPYGDVRTNSFCHAWSCTPTLLLRGSLMASAKGRRRGTITMGEVDEAWLGRTEDDL
ncbi:Six-hairpin glycosidase-like protein [Plectosphaerella plurivora]|uniref:Six-hairpin glycosidase-like protein n=1 Tax=Plectosphaerella plurivora TaxID=936078 RepID=A0A9P8V4D8_9PEZI|nr:Six-hairpin glycosidase-like protein [Plectosphaerella plurivora]